MIDITGCDLRKLVAKAYELSSPQGTGFLHFNAAPLTEAEIDAIIRPDERYVVDMDYVNGRSCKFHVLRDGAGCRLTIGESWYDHTSEQLGELLAHINVERQPTL